MVNSVGVKRFAIGAGIVVAGLSLAACSTNGSGYATRDALVAPVNCANQTFGIYFDEGQTQLAPAALTLLQMRGQQLSGCDIRKVSVTGLASATGDSAANQALSERRAKSVSEALTAQGWPEPVFAVNALGAEGAREGQVNEPLRRRTEVLVEAAPRR